MKKCLKFQKMLKKNFQIILFSFLFFQFFLNFSYAEKIECVVKKIVDGDTFYCSTWNNKTIKVRMYCIDTPERGQKHYKEAKEYLKSLIYQKIVILDIKKRDRYKRYVAEVFLKKCRNNINILMIKKSLAYPSPRRWIKCPEKYYKSFQGADFQPPWEYRKSKKTKNH